MYLDYNTPDAFSREEYFEKIIDVGPWQDFIANGILAALPKKLEGVGDLSELAGHDVFELERAAVRFRREFAPEDNEEAGDRRSDPYSKTCGEEGSKERMAIRYVRELVSMASLCIRAAAHEAYALDLTEEEAAYLAANKGIRLSLYGWTDPVEGRTVKGAYIRTNYPDLIFFDADADRSTLTSEERFYDACMRRFKGM